VVQFERLFELNWSVLAEFWVRVNQHIRFPPNANDFPLSAPPACWLYPQMHMWEKRKAEMRDVNLPGPLNFVLFHLIHEYNLSLCMNITVTNKQGSYKHRNRAGNPAFEQVTYSTILI
jgi:hypothetical protein